MRLIREAFSILIVMGMGVNAGARGLTPTVPPPIERAFRWRRKPFPHTDTESQRSAGKSWHQTPGFATLHLQNHRAAAQDSPPRRDAFQPKPTRAPEGAPDCRPKFKVRSFRVFVAQAGLAAYQRDLLACDEDVLDVGFHVERITVGDDHVRGFACVERAQLVGDSPDFSGV